MTGGATKGRGRASVIASTVQVALSSIVFFIVFRYLYGRVGVDQIGVWSLVLAATSVSRIGELGLSAGVVRYVAQALGRGETRRAADIVQTTCLALVAIMGALLLALYPVCAKFLAALVPEQQVDLALRILPYALVSLWINIAASVFSGALDGCTRIDLRCLATGAAHLVFLILVLALTPGQGLVGVARAQLWQAAFLCVLTWVLLRRELRTLPALPHRWRSPLLREMLGYGLSFQAISIVNLLFEPVVKALLGKFGGLAALGHFEMSNKLLLQARSVVVEAGRILVPSVASLDRTNEAAARALFTTSYALTFFVSIVLYGALGILLASLALVWLGQIDSQFLLFAVLLNAGWFVNTLIGPAYFSNLGSGRLRNNVISHVIMGLVAAVAGWLLGWAFGGTGVVLGMVLGLVSGSIYLLVSYLRQAGFEWTQVILPRGLGVLLSVAIALSAVSVACAMQLPGKIPTITTGTVCALALFSVSWRHPARRQLLGSGKDGS